MYPNYRRSTWWLIVGKRIGTDRRLSTYTEPRTRRSNKSPGQKVAPDNGSVIDDGGG